MRRPVAYLRKSKVTSDRHVSWQIQETEIRSLAAKHGDSDLEFMSDWNRSGRGDRTKARIEYLRLREMVNAGQVSVVYGYSLSRLARSVAEFASFAKTCASTETVVRLAKEGDLDFATPAGRFYVNILASLAEMEADLAQERARDTIAVRRARGDHIGSAGYGKRLDRGRLVDYPSEAVDNLIDAYRTAGSFAGAARLLNAQGRRGKQGAIWDGNVINRILKREVPEVVVPSNGTRTRGVKALAPSLLYRLVRCPCGQIMSPKRDNPRHPAYICHRGRYDISHSRPYMVPEHRVFGFVKDEVARLRTPNLVALADARDERREMLEARRQRIIDNYEDGLIGKTERDKKVAAVAEELVRIAVEERVVDVPQLDWSWPPEQINLVLRALFEYVQLDEAMHPVRATWLVPEWRTG